MNRDERREKAGLYDFKTWRDFPPMNVSMGNMLHNRTGSWRFIKPVYEDKVPACQQSCPAGNDIEAWIKLMQRGEYERAYWYVKREEPFPAILGRVCFRFCEGNCNRAPLDEEISIRELERFVGEQVPFSIPYPELASFNGKSLCVVGSGPAGMSAAYFARILGFQVTILEALPVLGGMLRVGIPAYRLPRSIVEQEFTGLRNMGIDLKPNMAVGKDISLEECLQRFDYVFLAPGVHGSRKLGIPGENSPKVMSGLGLLRKIAMGEAVSLGRRVIIIGGGNTAIDAARSAVRLGSDVTILYRRTEAEMPAHPDEIAEAREEGVGFQFLAAPERIEVKEGGTIANLVCCEMELGKPDESGRRRPVRKEGALFDVKADTVITAIGEVAAFDPMARVLEESGGGLDVDEGLRVGSLEIGKGRVFAGGDIVDAPRTVVHAVAAGKRAAVAIDCDRKGIAFSEVLEEITVGAGPGISFSSYMGWEPVNPVRGNLKAVVRPEHIVYDYFEKAPRIQKMGLPASERKKNFDPYEETFTGEQALGEAARCMHCGRCTECDNCLVLCPDVSVLVKGNGEFGYVFDYNYCKGCGICFTECPRHAITMVDEETPVEGS
ncbi:MAG: FAD-dependent oxidoreductase [Deltaproteobacteria bacterium]|nr:FAD-dependent oxidoreductase [Deltaproteobacteria bacterium]